MVSVLMLFFVVVVVVVEISEEMRDIEFMLFEMVEVYAELDE
jgi:hypothetical protein